MREMQAAPVRRSRFRRISAVVFLLLLMLMMLSLSACADGRGSATAYDGFVVRTERAREEDAPEPEAPAERAMPGADEKAEDYVLNMNSMKFHYPSCPSVKDIKESNRWDYHGTRESVIELGYRPCKNCSP